MIVWSPKTVLVGAMSRTPMEDFLPKDPVSGLHPLVASGQEAVQDGSAVYQRCMGAGGVR